MILTQNNTQKQIHIEKFDYENEIDIKIETKNDNLNIWLTVEQVKELSEFLIEELKRIKPDMTK